MSVFIAYKAYGWGKTYAVWIFGAVAVLFNPLLPIHLSKEIWQPIDVIVSLLFIMSLAVLRKPEEVVKNNG